MFLKMLTSVNKLLGSQFPFGGDVSTFIPLRSSALDIEQPPVSSNHPERDFPERFYFRIGAMAERPWTLSEVHGDIGNFGLPESCR
jgi:hypothetical protein